MTVNIDIDVMDRLKDIVDQHSMARVIELLAEIAYFKEELALDKMRDKVLAKEWERAAKLLNTLAIRLNNF